MFECGVFKCSKLPCVTDWGFRGLEFALLDGGVLECTNMGFKCFQAALCDRVGFKGLECTLFNGGVLECTIDGCFTCL